MPAIGFMAQHVPSVLDGSKPFTMRKPRKDGRDPKVGDDLHLFENWRTPAMRKFATAACVMRTTLWFDHRGIAKVQHDGLAEGAPFVFVSVGQAIVQAGDPEAVNQELALHRLATWDGFSSWTDLWAFHQSYGKLDANGHAMRRLIGLGNVQPVASGAS